MELTSFTPMGERLISSLSEVSPLFISECNGNQKDKFVLIACDEINCTKPNIYPPPWNKIVYAWSQIQSSCPESEITAWRDITRYGFEISPANNVYLLRQNNSQERVYFCLLSENDFDKALGQLMGSFLDLWALQHIKQNRALFHSAAIIEENSAFLFMGKSGSGKSTVCTLSGNNQYTVIHDDHVVVYKDEQGVYAAANQSISMPGVPVQALFFLIQDTSNYLSPLPPIETAKRLMNSSMESMASDVLYGQLLNNTFAISASIARCIPSYDLHFRKSPDFWDVIHSEIKSSDN